jgi:hypothetical protein
MPSGQAEMSENPGDHSGIIYSSDDLQCANAAMTVLSRLRNRPGLKAQLNHPEELRW